MRDYDERVPSSARYDGRSAVRGDVRVRGVSQLRRINNWTLAALLVGVGATTAVLGHSLVATPPAPNTSISGFGSTSAASSGSNGPSLTQPVATSSGSGVSSAATTLGGAGTSPSSRTQAVATSGGS